MGQKTRYTLGFDITTPQARGSVCSTRAFLFLTGQEGGKDVWRVSTNLTFVSPHTLETTHSDITVKAGSPPPFSLAVQKVRQFAERQAAKNGHKGPTMRGNLNWR